MTLGELRREFDICAENQLGDSVLFYIQENPEIDPTDIASEFSSACKDYIWSLIESIEREREE